MVFLMFTFDSDHLTDKFLSMTFCSLLKTGICMSYPKVFFTEDRTFDCECDILVVKVEENVPKDIYCKGSNKAKIVLYATDPLKGFDRFISYYIQNNKPKNEKECRLSTLEMGFNENIYFVSDEIYFLNSHMRFELVNTGVVETKSSLDSNKFNRKLIKRISEYGELLGCKILSSTNWITGTFPNHFFHFSSEPKPKNLDGFLKKDSQSPDKSFQNSKDFSENKCATVSSSAPSYSGKRIKRKLLTLKSDDYSNADKIVKTKCLQKFPNNHFYTQNNSYRG